MEPISIAIIIIIASLALSYSIYGADTFSDPVKVISKIKKDIGVDKDCITSEWSEWDKCKEGKKKRTRTIIEDPLGDGNECGVLQEEVDCVEDKDCVLSEWSAWSACKEGKRSRTRNITQEQSGKGKVCDVLKEEQNCIDAFDSPEIGIDYWGNDINYYQTNNKDACAELCLNNPECKLFALSTRYNQCWIKTKAENKQSNPERIVYKKK